MANFILMKNTFKPGPEHARLEGMLMARMGDIEEILKHGKPEPLMLVFSGIVQLLAGMHGVGMQDLFEQLTEDRVGLLPDDVERLDTILRGVSERLRSFDKEPELAALAESIDSVAEELAELRVEAVPEESEAGPLPELDLEH